LRYLDEVHIAELFSKYPQYFTAFRSCNKGSKEDKWCNNCPKCLFAFIMLYPFLDNKNLMNIFGENLFEKPNLLKTTKELLGISGHKPFDCVGTYKESRKAISLALKKTKLSRPYILNKISREINYQAA